MKTFIKPSGAELLVNSSSEAHAISLGWILKGSDTPQSEPKPESKPRGRPPKVK